MRATRELLVISACLLTFLLYLALERLRLDRARRRVPLRISVTGTRGKSGVTRLIAAGLRESGVRVLAKTTGSRAVLIFPDGTEEEMPRPGTPSIREQVRVVGRAAGMKAEALVAEMMSVGEECLFTESRRIVRPGILALTNVRLDHLDEMGRRKEDIARTLSAAFPEGGTIFSPKEESYPVFEESAARTASTLHPVARSAAVEGHGEASSLPFDQFEPNVRLALAVLASLGVGEETAMRGMAHALPDLGSLRVWQGRFGDPPRPALCVSAFAANDPESSAAVLEKVKTMLPAGPKSLLGLLCLREDRGDRTLQWVGAAGAGFFADFERVAVVGSPAKAAAKKLRKVPGLAFAKFSFFKDPRPAELMDQLVNSAGREPVIVGLGNIVGSGEMFVRHWEEAGTPYGR
jgi:poly-gamma-glutamate synthase PgsB/CapB